MSGNWVAVAAAEHVRRGRAAGFMQVCHGKAAPLRRVKPGDRVVYYSPTVTFRGTDGLQAFTAFGVVKDGEPFAVDMGGGFCPFRREVDWFAGREVPIVDLRDRLSFTAGRRNWGYVFRTGLFAIDCADMRTIATAMGLGALPAGASPAGQLAEPAEALA